MWGPLSKADERYYKRRAAEDIARKRRMEEREADMPRRMEILARVKAGEITLAEGQRMIRRKPTAEGQGCRASRHTLDPLVWASGSPKES
jgi:hypothetical protein